MPRLHRIAGTATLLALSFSAFAPSAFAASGAQRADIAITAPAPGGVKARLWDKDEETAQRDRYRRYRDYRHYRDRTDVGDVIAGVLILGGIAAVIDAASNSERRDRGDRYERNSPPRYPEQRYNDSDEINAAADRCAYAAEQRAGGDARVETISSVVRDGNGWRVEGMVANYGGGENFQCGVTNGRVDYIQLSGPDYFGNY